MTAYVDQVGSGAEAHFVIERGLVRPGQCLGPVIIPEAPQQRPEPKRDRFGRYMIPAPTGDKPKPYTRVTTLAKTLDDAFGLTLWKQRQVARGLAQRPDLVAMVASVGEPADQAAKRRLDDLCENAMEAVGSSAGANLGTALHALTEGIDLGQQIIVPPAQKPDLDAYSAEMTRLQIRILPEWVERIVVLDSLGVAGTLDRIVRYGDQLMIADLKTAQTLDWSWGSIAAQLACYARAERVFDPATGQCSEPLAGVDLEHALVIHLPAGQARCEVHVIDIAAGWEAVQQASWVRNWRKRKDLSRRLDSPPVTVERVEAVFGAVEHVDVVDDLRAWCVERLQVVKNWAAGPAWQQLAAMWPADVPGFKSDHRHSEAELDRVIELLNTIEARHQIPFPDRSDPRKSLAHEVSMPAVLLESDRPATPEELAAAKAMVDQLEEWQLRTLGILLAQAPKELSWNLRVEPTLQKYRTASAVVTLLRMSSPGDLTPLNHTVAAVIGRPIPGAIGEELGCLTFEEATALERAALHLRTLPAGVLPTAEEICSAISWTPIPIGTTKQQTQKAEAAA